MNTGSSAGVRTVEFGWPEKTTRTYATSERCAHEARKLCEGLDGVCNIRIVPVVDWPEGQAHARVRYTAIFFCFSDEADIFHLARVMGTKHTSFTIHR